jgi:hypothetical protein
MKKLTVALGAAFLLLTCFCSGQTIPVNPYSQGSWPSGGLPKLCGFSSGIPVFCPSNLVDTGSQLLYNGSPLAGGGVSEINGLTGNVVFSAGSNITLTPSGNTITISASSTASTAFSALTGSTNTTAAMICGSGCSLGIAGSGSIAASSAPASGITGSVVPLTGAPSAAQLLVGNAGGTAFAPVSLSGDSTLTAAGVMRNTGLNGVALSSLASCLLKNTTATGVPVCGAAGTDYVVPSGNITGNAANVTGIVPIANGGTGAATAAAALTALGAAPLASPAFTGVPTAPTASPGTNNGQIADTAFVTAAVAAGGGSLPSGSQFNTLYNSGAGTTYSADTSLLDDLTNLQYAGSGTNLPFHYATVVFPATAATLTSGVTSTATSIPFTTTGYLSPSPRMPIWLVLWHNTFTNVEIMSCTASTGSGASNCTRAQGGTTAAAWVAGDTVYQIAEFDTASLTASFHHWIASNGYETFNGAANTPANIGFGGGTLDLDNVTVLAGDITGPTYPQKIQAASGIGGWEFNQTTTGIDSNGMIGDQDPNIAVTAATTVIAPVTNIVNLTGIAPTGMATITAPSGICTVTGNGCVITFSGVGFVSVTTGNIGNVISAAQPLTVCAWTESVAKWYCH